MGATTGVFADLEPRDFHQGGDCSILYSVVVSGKSSKLSGPRPDPESKMSQMSRRASFYIRSAVSGKTASRGEGLRSLAIFKGANGIYRQSTVVVVAVYGYTGSYVSDESRVS